MLAVGGPMSSPARADCVYVDIQITHQNAPPSYPAGSDPCRYQTSWATFVTLTPHATHHGGVPDGTPNGFYIEARIPVP